VFLRNVCAFTSLDGVRTQDNNIVILTAARISNLSVIICLYCVESSVTETMGITLKSNIKAVELEDQLFCPRSL
jgi:hypothetical protein